MGFTLENKAEALLWLKHKFWLKGIGPEQFKKAQMRDIMDIMDIEGAISERKEREGAIQDAINSMGRH